MDKSVQVFNFEEQKIDVIEIDGHPWFIGKEIGLALGYTINTYRNGIKDNVPQEEIGTVSIGHSASDSTHLGSSTTTIISLPGVMYWAIRSHVSNADAFANWVIYDVLLSINNLQGRESS